jgi:uncharacterized protein YaaN involved in tellurite resistance
MNDEILTQTVTSLTPAPFPTLTNALTEERKLNLSKFTEEQRDRIRSIAAATPVLDSGAVMRFGADAQERMNAYLDELMQGMRTSEVGVAGELTIELARNIKAMNLNKMKREASGQDWVARTFGRVPIVGKWASAMRYFQLTHQKITKHFTAIEEKARREMGLLAGHNSKLDRLAEKTLQNLNDLEIYLAAGQAVLMRARNEFIQKRDVLAATQDPIALTSLRDAAEQINAFETRILRMHIAFTDALNSLPQIRINQEAARIEMRNIMDTLLFDMPRLKSAILRVASLNQIMRASKTNEARRALARQIGSIGAEALDAAYTRAKESQGSGAEDVAVLAATADKLLETIAKGVALDETNRAKREEAHRHLGEIKDKLLSGLSVSAQQLAGRGV